MWRRVTGTCWQPRKRGGRRVPELPAGLPGHGSGERPGRPRTTPPPGRAAPGLHADGTTMEIRIRGQHARPHAGPAPWRDTTPAGRHPRPNVPAGAVRCPHRFAGCPKGRCPGGGWPQPSQLVLHPGPTRREPAVGRGWEAWTGGGGIRYARRPKSIPPIVVRAATAAELAATGHPGWGPPAVSARDRCWEPAAPLIRQAARRSPV